MPNKRVQSRMNRPLYDAEEEADRHDWADVVKYARTALPADPPNEGTLNARRLPNYRTRR
jgi:hypothetical protein